MNAYKLNSSVPKNKKIILNVPPEVPTGPVEIILIFSEKTGKSSEKNKINTVLTKLGKKKKKGKTKEEIDMYVARERESWD